MPCFGAAVHHRSLESKPADMRYAAMKTQFPKTTPHHGAQQLTFVSPQTPGEARFSDPVAAIDHVEAIYLAARSFLSEAFVSVMAQSAPHKRYRAYYPEICIEIGSHASIDSRLSFGHFSEPGTYSSTITRPDLFRDYLEQQLALIVENHGVEIVVRPSEVPIPVHFALSPDTVVDGRLPASLPLRDMFDVPELATIDDGIINARAPHETGEQGPLAPFTAQRVDYSLARLSHYTATQSEHFQDHVLFTNYQFYVDEFISFSQAAVEDENSGYSAFVQPGNVIQKRGEKSGNPPARLPQMPAYHLTRPDGSGITLINIGVGPSNAKTITDHIAVLRPHAWVMVGHCAGLRNSQSLGDYVLAHAYVREDHVLDADLPTWVPIPALAEIQVALQDAVAQVTGLEGYELKRIMRTGTVATIDNRNWELRDQSGPVQRLSLTRAIALDMESATIAANGFRFRVPYGTLLCVSDKPLHGELKLPGMATEFYHRQVSQHLLIGIRAMESLRDMPLERLHSRKLRSFDETAFL